MGIFVAFSLSADDELPAMRGNTIMLSFGTGRTTILQGIVLLVLFAVYLFTTIFP